MTERTWLITGVSSGFGRELATQLLDRGEVVVGTVRQPDSVLRDRIAGFEAQAGLTASTDSPPAE